MIFHDHIIVGGGPSGVQMGYFLETAGRDYLILEAKDTVGSFFTQFPRHRRLNSINKRFNWSREPDFNLRFDWHFLLTHDYSFPYRGYSRDVSPQADTLAQYIQEFRDHFDIKVRFDTRVTFTDRDPGTRHFILTTAGGEEYRCRTLLMATGPLKGHVPDIPGIEHASRYQDHDGTLETYDDKRVLIIGGGISAFETANHLAGVTAALTIAFGPWFMKHAWRTHFDGDLRSHDNTVLDMAALKMLHGIYSIDITRITKQEDGVLRARYREEFPHWTTPGVADGWMPVDHVICRTGWTFIDENLFAPPVRPRLAPGGRYPLLSPARETTTPDLFFIGSAMSGRNDPAKPGCVPVLRLYDKGSFVKERNIRGPAGVQYDEAYEGFEHDMDDAKPRNILLNFINEAAGVTDRVFAEKHFFNNDERGGFRAPEPGEKLHDPGLPECALTVGGDQVADFGQFSQVKRRDDGTILPWAHSKLFEIEGVH